MNQPNRIDSWLLEDGEKALTITEDPKIPNAATVMMRKQDHTLANMIRSQLLLDPSVLFAGYKVPHPLENDVLIKIQTDDRSNPADALKRACTLLMQQVIDIKKQFSQQAQRIEMGLAPEVAQPAGVPGVTGQYDPYGDGMGLGSQTYGGGQPTQPGQDVYDF